MKIALDFDGTFTADPYLWRDFIGSAIGFGHEVRIVTARDEHNDGINWKRVGCTMAPCPVIFCDGRAKRKVVREQGFAVDVWIDDNPYGVIASTSFAGPETLLAWRQQDEYRGSTLPPTGESRGFAERAKENGTAHPEKPVVRPLRRAAEVRS